MSLLTRKNINRRNFIRFIAGGYFLAVIRSSFLGFLYSCREGNQKGNPENKIKKILGLHPLKPSSEDQLLLAEGFSYKVLVKWGDPIGDHKKFGSHNDYLAFLPVKNKNEGLLWVNHENMEPLFVHGFSPGKTTAPTAPSKKTKKHVDQEQKEVGGSIIYIKKNQNTGKWSYVKNHRLNRRLDAKTKIPLVSPRPIEGSRVAVGTFANCAGGMTPWKTVLTCEENYEDFYGDYTKDHPSGIRRKTAASFYGWDEYYSHPPEHYGWVVEVDPMNGAAKKLTALGRFSHEGATTIQAGDRLVVYMGDDAKDQCLYKFISDKKNSLESGELFVANTEKGEWISLDYKKSRVLQKNFKDQTDVLIYTRKAARLVGGTPLDRPEDIEIHPKTGSVFIALTNNLDKGVPHGSLLKLREKNNNPLSMKFKASTFLVGGESAGFSCPDNLSFDHLGNLWFTNDIPSNRMNRGVYRPFKNNGLFYVPMSGPLMGQVFQVASAPANAEMTGVTFLPDHTLLVSVQHPGERTTDIKKPLSRWPDYGDDIPRSAVVAISRNII